MTRKRWLQITSVCAGSARTVEGCGKEEFVWIGVLTIREGMLILVSSLEATLLDREAEQTLFDN